jgi:AcrR family transcriptional regulator
MNVFHMIKSRTNKVVLRCLYPDKATSPVLSTQIVDGILAAAADILEQFGLDAYTMDAVAARAGLSVDALSHYFPSHDALTIALIEREAGALATDVVAALALEDESQTMRAMIEAAVRHRLRRPKLAALLDFEERRLASSMSPSGNAAVVRSAVANFVESDLFSRLHSPIVAASDLMTVVGALTEVAASGEKRGEKRGAASPAPGLVAGDKLVRKVCGA